MREPTYVYTVVRIDSPTEFDTVRSTKVMAAVHATPAAATRFMVGQTAHEAVLVSTNGGITAGPAAAALARGEILRYGRYHLGRVELNGAGS